MAIFEDVFKNGLGGGLALAVGAVVLGPILLPTLGRAVKPVVKGAIKGGIVAYGWGREGLAEMREYVEDTYAEAAAEMELAEEEEVGERAGRARGKGKPASRQEAAQSA